MPAESVMQLIYLNYFSWILQSWNKIVPSKSSFFSTNKILYIVFPLQLSSWVNYILMGKVCGFEVVISKSWRIQRNCINEKLGAEIQNRGEAAAPEQTLPASQPQLRGGTRRVPVKRRAGLSSRESPRGLRGDGVEAKWRQQQHDRHPGGAETGEGDDSGQTGGRHWRDSSRNRRWLEAVTQPRKNWCGPKAHLDFPDKTFLNLNLGTSGPTGVCFMCAVSRKHTRV